MWLSRLTSGATLYGTHARSSVAATLAPASPATSLVSGTAWPWPDCRTSPIRPLRDHASRRTVPGEDEPSGSPRAPCARTPWDAGDCRVCLKVQLQVGLRGLGGWGGACGRVRWCMRSDADDQSATQRHCRAQAGILKGNPIPFSIVLAPGSWGVRCVWVV